MGHTSDKAQAASKLSHAFKPSTWFRAKEVHEPPKPKLQGIYWSGELLQRLVDLQEQHPNGTSDEERSQILKDLGQRFWRAHPECWQHVEMELEHLKKGTTEVLWNLDMEQRLAELFCRSRLFTLDAPKAVLYNEFGARSGRGEIYNKIQELKLVKRIQFDLILGGWTYPGMTKGWVGPDGAGEYGVP